MSVSVGDSDGGTIAYVLSYAAYPGVMPCDRPAMPMRRDALGSRLPVLDVRPDEYRGGAGSSGGLDSASTAVELGSERTPAEIADGIAEQVTAEGWVPSLAADGDGDAIRTWSRTFDDGFEARGVLTVVALDPGTYEVMFRLKEVPEAGR